jgi:tRNA threonylcarbamoyladenosine biosynthesis protein TsaB
MLILACDTSGAALSAAIWRDGHLLAEAALAIGQPHAVTLLPLIEDLLGRCSIATPAIDAFACAVGPGSYTGIRIGVSTIKGMAYAAGKPAVGISTLQAMAWPYFGCTGLIVCPVLDARNQRIYTAAWQNGEEVIPAANRLASDFVKELKALISSRDTLHGHGVLLVGHCPEAFFQSCGKPVIADTQLAPAVSALPRASAIAELAEIRLSQGDKGLPALIVPQYLSPSQAERLKAAALD